MASPRLVSWRWQRRPGDGPEPAGVTMFDVTAGVGRDLVGGGPAVRACAGAVPRPSAAVLLLDSRLPPPTRPAGRHRPPRPDSLPRWGAAAAGYAPSDPATAHPGGPSSPRPRGAHPLHPTRGSTPAGGGAQAAGVRSGWDACWRCARPRRVERTGEWRARAVVPRARTLALRLLGLPQPARLPAVAVRGYSPAPGPPLHVIAFRRGLAAYVFLRHRDGRANIGYGRCAARCTAAAPRQRGKGVLHAPCRCWRTTRGSRDSCAPTTSVLLLPPGRSRRVLGPRRREPHQPLTSRALLRGGVVPRGRGRGHRPGAHPPPARPVARTGQPPCCRAPPPPPLSTPRSPAAARHPPFSRPRRHRPVAGPPPLAPPASRAYLLREPRDGAAHGVASPSPSRPGCWVLQRRGSFCGSDPARGPCAARECNPRAPGDWARPPPEARFVPRRSARPTPPAGRRRPHLTAGLDRWSRCRWWTPARPVAVARSSPRWTSRDWSSRSPRRAIPLVSRRPTITYPNATGVARHHGFGEVALVHFAPRRTAHPVGQCTHARRCGADRVRRVPAPACAGLRGYWPPPNRGLDAEHACAPLHGAISARGWPRCSTGCSHSWQAGPGGFVSFDIDVVYPGMAPGTGTPIPRLTSRGCSTPSAAWPRAEWSAPTWWSPPHYHPPYLTAPGHPLVLELTPAIAERAPSRVRPFDPRDPALPLAPGRSRRCSGTPRPRVPRLRRCFRVAPRPRHADPPRRATVDGCPRPRCLVSWSRRTS